MYGKGRKISSYYTYFFDHKLELPTTVLWNKEKYTQLYQIVYISGQKLFVYISIFTLQIAVRMDSLTSPTITKRKWNKDRSKEENKNRWLETESNDK